MSLAKALVYGYAWVLLAGVVVYAYAEGIARVDAEDPVHSGARPDSRHYVACEELPSNTLPPCGE